MRERNSSIRPISIKQGILTRDGSASFRFGKSCVICSVHGPAEVKIRDEKLDKATIDVVVRPLTGTPGTKDKMHEYILRSIFENVIQSGLHPRTLIQIALQVVEDDGSILATSINATTLALMDAGIPMKSMVMAVSCILNENGEILVDPTLQEMENVHSTHTFAFDNTSSNLLFCNSSGIYSEEQYFNCYELCHKASHKVLAEIQESVEFKLNNEDV